ncbi:MAG: hypothetical protein DWQ01_05915 [Planctomycetota bacterium]|nr:MAG: hypothetical protein DWQ01_05915 [Planctomycetota bacterium]
MRWLSWLIGFLLLTCVKEGSEQVPEVAAPAPASWADPDAAEALALTPPLSQDTSLFGEEAGAAEPEPPVEEEKPLPPVLPTTESEPASGPAPDFGALGGFQIGSRPGRALTGRLSAGLCDYPNASLGLWRAYGRGRSLEGGLVRTRSLFLQQANLPKVIAGGLEAKAAGMDVLLMVHAAPEHFEGWLSDAKRYEETYNRMPNDYETWGERAAEITLQVIQAGVPVTHVEIWGEPERRNSKDGPEEFARFFATANKILRRELPKEVKIGGPGMAGAFAHGMDFFEAILKACKKKRVTPEFLSWHQYEGWATDTAAFRIDTRLQNMAREILGREVELILGEWSLALPSPTHPMPQLDDHRNAVHWLATVSSLVTETSVEAQCYFMFQDGNWEAKQDFAGQSPGLFTINGAPKAIVVGQRMLDLAAELPAVHMERKGAPWNLACYASGEGDRRLVLVSNAIRMDEGRVKKALDQRDVDFHLLPKEKRNTVYAYIRGRAPYSRLGLPPQDESKWEEAREILRISGKAGKQPTPVWLGFDRPIARLGQVWAIDENRGNPAAHRELVEYLKKVAYKRRMMSPEQKRQLKANPEMAWEKEAEAYGAMLDLAAAKPPQLSEEEAAALVELDGRRCRVQLPIQTAYLYEFWLEPENP